VLAVALCLRIAVIGVFPVSVDALLQVASEFPSDRRNRWKDRYLRIKLENLAEEFLAQEFGVLKRWLSG